jgi:type II secretory pathway component PulK
LINLNTASGAVLQALFPNMTDVDAEVWMAGRPYADVTTAIANQYWADGVDKSRLSVASDTFMVRTEARFGRAIMREEYMLLRQSKKMTLLARERLAWEHP